MITFIIKNTWILILLLIATGNGSSSHDKGHEMGNDKDIIELEKVAMEFIDHPSSIPKYYLDNDSLTINYNDIYIELVHIENVENKFLIITRFSKKEMYYEGPKWFFITELKKNTLCYFITVTDEDKDKSIRFLYIKKNEFWKLIEVKLRG